ncbi:MAG: hypothetical protein WBI20_14850 [Burkholderiaceae bacterium]
MSKLSAALGDKFEAKKPDLLIRSFELGGHTFRVRIPLVAESDAIYARLSLPQEDAVNEAFHLITKDLDKFKDAESSEMQFTPDDVMVQGRSMREAARNRVITEMRITEFIKLLVPEVQGATLDDLTYAEIEQEFPLPVQLALVEKIAEAVTPGYKETRKN